MNNDLFERVLIQLQPELAQEFGLAVLEDKKKLKALEILKEYLTIDEKEQALRFKDKLSGIIFIKLHGEEQEQYKVLKKVLKDE